MGEWKVDVRNMDKVWEAAQKYDDGSEAEKIINCFLWGKGAQEIIEGITPLLPKSGRTWKGKDKSASDAAPDFFKVKTSENFAVTVHTHGKYHYLYFPDDGGDTKHHAGNQTFMFRGMASKVSEMTDEMVNELIENLQNQ